MKKNIIFVFIIFASFFLQNCSSAGSGDGKNDTNWFHFGDTGDVNMGKDIPAQHDIETKQDVTKNKIKLVFLYPPDTPVNRPVGSTETMGVLALNYETEQPEPDLPITFFITKINGSPSSDFENLDGYGKLATNISYTKNDGVAKITFLTGQKIDTEYTIRATAKQSEPAFQDIFITDTPKGDLEIDPKNESALPLHTIRVMLLPGAYNCDYFKATKEPDGIIESYTISTVDSTVKFKNLAVNTPFTVAATAKGPSGTLTAKGCIDGVMVQPDTVNKKSLPLYLLTLNPAGCYDMVSDFDFTNAIPGEAGKIINLVVELFYDPGNFILDMVITLVKQYFGEFWGNIADTVMGPFKKMLGDLITNWLFDNSPDWLQCMFQVGQDLTQIVANAELVGCVKLAKLTSDYYIQGEEDWTGINLFWTLGCSQNGPCKGWDFNLLQDMCGYNEEKDKCMCPVTLQQLQNSSVPLDLINGTFTAQIANFNSMIIETHQISLNYGKLILFILNDVIIYAASDGQYNSIEQLLKSVIDCHAVAYGMTGDLLDKIGIDKDKVEDFCNGAVGFLVSPIEEVIGSLSIDSTLRVHGSCKLIDDNEDLIVDALKEGLWFGYVEANGQQGDEFKGTWEATRSKNCCK